MPAIIINSLLFGLASSCFRERSLNTQVVGNKYVLHLLSSVVFSSFAGWGERASLSVLMPHVMLLRECLL